MLAPYFHGQLILGPALIIILAVFLGVLVRYPSYRHRIGRILVLIGFLEVMLIGFVVWLMPFLWGILIGFVTFFAGIVLAFSKIGCRDNVRFSPQKSRRLKKGIYLLLVVVVVSCALLLTVRTTTNLIHEQRLETYRGDSTPNLTFRGELTTVALNHEVNTGYSYRIFPAYITFKVTEVVWGRGYWENQTVASEYWQQKTVTVYYEKTDVPTLSVGQQIEVSGYWMPWLEDSLYSGALVVAPQIVGSYVELASFAEVTPSNVQLGDVGYLKLPSLPTEDNGYSKLFLVSATAKYGMYNGQECFIMNATIRNDYSAQQLPPDGPEGYDGSGTAYFIIKAKLYAQNMQIAAQEITNPYTMPVRGSPQHSLDAGATESFELYLATSDQNINLFTLYLVAIGGFPIP